MADNNATVTYESGLQTYYVRVNGTMVYATDDKSRADIIASRLNALFSDKDRDLDFITPSFANGMYVVTCPLVRKNVGQVTYLYDTNGSDGWRSYPEKLYEPTNWNDTRDKNQTAITTILTSESTRPWYSALSIANNIRRAINLNFPDANGNTKCKELITPSNTGSTPISVISNSAICDYYGLPCQGTEPGTHSTCPEIGFPAENILNVYTRNGEVFHPQGLTAAMTPTNKWSTDYMNKFVKVTNLSNSKSIIVRVTDEAPANRGIELSYRAWVEIGKPSGANSVKIELMS